MSENHTKYPVEISYLRYPAQMKKKIETMLEILSKLPSTFTMIQKSGKTFSSRTVSQRLKEMQEMGIVKKDYNLYLMVPESDWGKQLKNMQAFFSNRKIGIEKKLKVLCYLKLKNLHLVKCAGKTTKEKRVSGEQE